MVYSSFMNKLRGFTTYIGPQREFSRCLLVRELFPHEEAPFIYKYSIQRCSERLSHMCKRKILTTRLLRHKSSMTSPPGWEQQINRVPPAGRSSGSGW